VEVTEAGAKRLQPFRRTRFDMLDRFAQSKILGQGES